MKIEKDKAWWIARANREGDAAVSAGLLAVDPEPAVEPQTSGYASDETRLAFGRFVNLMRRRRQMTIERLAEEADLDVADLLVIEDDGARHAPEARTVYCLARAFNVPQRPLMELAGLSQARSPNLWAEAVRFAARSESDQKLTTSQKAALDAFVAVLSEQDLKTKK